MRILIAEDEPDVRDVLAAMLTEFGHDVALAPNCGMATQQLAETRYDLVLTDLVMPDGSGLALARQAQARGIATVLCTGHPGEVVRLEADGIEVLQKPFTLQSLLRVIDRAALRQAA